jgi:hypothetical protein
VTVEGPEALRIAANVVGLPELLGKAEPTKTRIAALRAQFTPVFAPSPSSRCPTSELKVGCGILGVILKMQSRAERAHGYRREAEKYAKLARSGQLDAEATRVACSTARRTRTGAGFDPHSEVLPPLGLPLCSISSAILDSRSPIVRNAVFASSS